MNWVTIRIPSEIYIPLPPDTFLGGLLTAYFSLGFVAVFEAYYHKYYPEDRWNPLLPFVIFFIGPIIVLTCLILFGLPGVGEEDNK